VNPQFPIRDVAWSPETARRFWEHEVTQTHNSFGAKHGRRIAAFVQHQFGRRCRRIVELGAGPGFLTQELVRAGYHVLAVEETEAGRRLCNDRNAGAAGFLGSVTFAEVREHDPFDAAVAVEVIEHLLDPDLASFLALLSDVVKPGGRCILTCPNAEHLADKAVLCPECGIRFHRWQHVRSVDAVLMASYLRRAGIYTTAVLATDWASWVPARLRGRQFPSRRSRAGPHLVGIGQRRV
jgi:2-polyprenyl-3-methyl-5-hydroxy-6-metoxy-1,4-benzoquinol methylase